jgi:hypothetical protein
MTRPVYCTNPDTSYSIVDKQEDGTCAIEFRSLPSEVAHLHGPSVWFTTSGGLLVFKVNNVKRLPGPPVGGKSLFRVECKRVAA